MSTGRSAGRGNRRSETADRRGRSQPTPATRARRRSDSRRRAREGSPNREDPQRRICVSRVPATRRLTWLGQAGFRLELEGVCVVVDPWTSPHELRAVPPPPLGLAEGVDWLLGYTEHLDHLDLGLLPVMMRRSPAVRSSSPCRSPRWSKTSCRTIGSSRCDPETGSTSTGSPPASFPRSTASRWKTHTATVRVLGEGPRFVGYALGASRPVYHAATRSSPTPCSTRSDRSASRSRSFRSTGATKSGKPAASSATWTPSRRSSSRSRSARPSSYPTTGTASREHRGARVGRRRGGRSPPRGGAGALGAARPRLRAPKSSATAGRARRRQTADVGRGVRDKGSRRRSRRRPRRAPGSPRGSHDGAGVPFVASGSASS